MSAFAEDLSWFPILAISLNTVICNIKYYQIEIECISLLKIELSTNHKFCYHILYEKHNIVKSYLLRYILSI